MTMFVFVLNGRRSGVIASSTPNRELRQLVSNIFIKTGFLGLVVSCARTLISKDGMLSAVELYTQTQSVIMLCNLSHVPSARPILRGDFGADTVFTAATRSRNSTEMLRISAFEGLVFLH